MQTRLPKIFLLVVCILSIQQKVSAATFDWSGLSPTSTNWTDPLNWTVSGLPTLEYPGQNRNTDIVQFGVNIGPYTDQPVLSTNVTVASITFGRLQYVSGAVLANTSLTGTILTVNGATLTVSGDITQNIYVTSTGTPASGSVFNDLRGTGTIICNNIQFGSTVSTNFGNFSFLFSEVAVLTVNTNVNINLNVKQPNGSGFRLENGTMTIGGQITFTNRGITAQNNSAYFTVNARTSYKTTNTITNPTLILNSTSAIGTIPTPFASCNFYGDHAPGGKATINYKGANPIIYTTATVGFGSGGGVVNTNAATDPTYDNLIIQGSGTAVIGGTTAGSTSYLNIDSTLKTYSNVSFSNATNTATTIGAATSSAASWSNYSTSTIIGGAGTIDINGRLTNEGTMTMGTGTLRIAKNYTNRGVFTPNTTSTTLIIFDGTTAQTLIDSTAAGTKFNNVTFTSGTTGATSKRMKSGSNFFVNPTYTINVNGSGILTVENTPSTYISALTLLSTTAGDASIGNLTAGSIAGKIEVQRYIKGGARRYMLLSSPVADTTNTAISTSSNSYSLKPIILPGTAGNKLSTIVTGPSGSTNGFDSAPATGNSPSVFVYNENAPSTADPNQIAGNEYKTFTNTSAAIPMGNGILFYFRGSRDLLNSTTGAPFVRPFPAADDATLTFFGSVIKGSTATNSPMIPKIINLPATNSTDASTYPVAGTTYPATLSYHNTIPIAKRGYNLLGNPYASVIDLSKVYAANNVINFYYLLIKNAATGLNSSSTRFVLYNGLANTFGTGGSKYVLSGQGFFVVATSATSFTFDEGMKVSYSTYAGTTPPIFNVKNGGPSVLSALAVNSNGSNHIKQAAASSAVAATKNNTNTLPWLRMDMMRDTSTFSTTDIYFGKNSQSKFVPGEDAPYLASSGQGDLFFSQTTDSIGCFANYTSDLEKLKRVNLVVTFSNYGLYKITSPYKANIDERYTIFLKDKFTNDSLDVVHNPEYSFNVTTDKASFAHDRFYLSIGIAPGHEYKLLDFNGAKVTAGIQLTWKTDNESNFTKFAVEKSTNGGKSFTAIDSLLSTGEGVYTFTDDKAPGTGQVTYRLMQTLVTGNTDISKNLTFNYQDSRFLKFIVYPTNAAQNININFGKTYSNRVKVNIVSSTGSMIKTITASNTDSIQQDVGNLLKGIYIVDAIDEATGKRIGSAKFFKQ